jgi:hypothetical protein
MRLMWLGGDDRRHVCAVLQGTEQPGALERGPASVWAALGPVQGRENDD